VGDPSSHARLSSVAHKSGCAHRMSASDGSTAMYGAQKLPARARSHSRCAERACQGFKLWARMRGPRRAHWAAVCRETDPLVTFVRKKDPLSYFL
jgi:hypothetical protein